MAGKTKSRTKGESAAEKRARLYFNTKEATDFLDCSYETLWRYRRNGLIDEQSEVLKHGHCLYYKKSAIQRLANKLIPG